MVGCCKHAKIGESGELSVHRDAIAAADVGIDGRRATGGVDATHRMGRSPQSASELAATLSENGASGLEGGG